MIDRVFNVFKTSEKTANMEDNQKKKRRRRSQLRRVDETNFSVKAKNEKKDNHEK